MKYKNNNKGYTIIELLVAVAIFSVVILGSVDIFIKSIESQKESFVESEVGNNARYAMEAMAKEIRMTESIMQSIPPMSYCSNQLLFINSKSEDIIYLLNGTQINRKKGLNPAVPITSDKVEVTDLSFCVNNWDLTVGSQPRVTISMTVEAPAGSPSSAEINLQTTLSLRIY